MLNGVSYFAGEFGHTTLIEGDEPCACGTLGCWEAYASDRATVQRYLKAKGMNCASGTTVTMADIVAAEKSGDRIAQEVSHGAVSRAGNCQHHQDGRSGCNHRWRRDYSCLGSGGRARVVVAFDPEEVILFGGLMNAGDLLVVPTRRSFEKHALAIARGRVRILVSVLNDGRAAILGASRLVRDALLEKCP